MVFPFAVYPTMMMGMLSVVNVTIPDIPWIIWNFIYVVLFYLAFVAVGKFILKLDVKTFEARAEEIYALYQGQKATKQQKIALIMMCIFLFVCLAPSLLPAGSLKEFFNQFGMAGGVFLVIAITSCMNIDGKPVTDWAKNAKFGINWDLIIMFVATTPIANALESADAGILTSVFALVMPVLNEMSGLMYMIIVWAAFLVITQFAHNIVVIMAFSPTLFALASSMGNVNMVLLAAGILVTANAAFLTPGASSPAAAVHSNTDWVDVRQAYIMGIVIIVVAIACMAAMTPLGFILF